MIFISHNHADKAIVEPIAIHLAQIFGREKVFYDSWSIQPGDAIVGKMDEGLSDCTHFFFFVSKNSLNSNMVKMEWQNAIYKSTKGACRVIPVRLDEQEMPSILAQSLYIDLFSNGLDAAIGQMVNVVQGNNTFSPSYRKFSNLSFSITDQSENQLVLQIRASHYLEPIAAFLLLIDNLRDELSFELPTEGAYFGGFNEKITLSTGATHNAQLIKAYRGITPRMPLTIKITPSSGVKIKFLGVLHQTGESFYSPIPCSS